jgi:hypothetical protein
MSNLTNGDFRGASFRDAELNRARLTGGRFAGADFSGADMNRADLRGADLSKAHGLTQEQVGRACGDANTRLPGRLTAGACRGIAGVRIPPPAPPVPPVAPTPPRVRNFVADGD